MRLFINKLQETVDARVLRERALIFASAIALLFIAWSFFIQAPFDDRARDMKTKFNELVAQRTATQQQIGEMNQTLLNDPGRLKEEQIKQLQADIDAIDIKLKDASHGLVKAEQLPQILEDVLLRTSKLTLLDVATLPVHELQVETVTGDIYKLNDRLAKNVQARRNLGVYEHVVQMRVAGSYSQITQFLIALEELPWRFYWQRLDYKVVEYPNAEIILRVYTLSSEEGLLGV